MAKKIVKRTKDGETLYFGTHTDAVQADSGNRKVSLTTFLQGIIDDFINYYTKSETYSKVEVDGLISGIKQFKPIVVDQTPVASADTMYKLYLVPSSNPDLENVKDEYITIETNGTYSWEQIGSTAIDLSPYATTDEMIAAISTALTNYYTKAQMDSALGGKQDTISDLSTIRSGAGLGATSLQPSDVDTEPTPNSGNPVSSGSVYGKVKPLEDGLSEIFDGGMEIGVTGGTILNKKISGTKWNAGGNYYCGIIAIDNNRSYRITANDNYDCYFAFLTSNASGAHLTNVENFATGCSLVTVTAGTTVTANAPSDGNYLYVQRANAKSATDTTLLPKEVFELSDLELSAKNVVIEGGEESVQEAIDSLNESLVGYSGVLDSSDWEHKYANGDYKGIAEENNYLMSPPIKIYKGDTVSVYCERTASYYSGRLLIMKNIAGMVYNLVPFVSGQTTFTYVADEDMEVILSGPNASVFTLTRGNRIIDNVIDKDFGTDDMYKDGLLGKTRVPSYTVNEGYIIDDGSGNLVIYTNDTSCCYTSPIAISKGEEIVLYSYYNRNSTPVFILSDANGTLSAPAGYESVNIDSQKLNEYRYKAKEDCYIIVSTLKTHGLYVVGTSKIQEYFDEADKSKSTDILSMYANRETENMLRQLTYGYNPSLGTFGNSTKPPLCLLHFSDVHANTVGDAGGLPSVEKNTDRIVQFYKKYESYITDVIHTGDSVYATAGGAFPWTDNEDVADFLNVIGNHDYDGQIDGDGSWAAKFGKFFAPYIEGWGVTLPPDAASEGKCYYYKDYTANNVRLVVLMNWGNVASSYLTTERTWLEGVLADAKTRGLTVMCAGHVSPAKISQLAGCSFNSWECANHGDANGQNTGGFATAVQTFIDGGGDFACWIGGHTHFDMVGPLEDFPEQFVILVENASCWSKWNADKRVAGTLSQDCFNVMSIDTVLKRVNVMRIGSNFASAMQHKGAFSYDWANKKLLNCW